MEQWLSQLHVRADQHWARIRGVPGVGIRQGGAAPTPIVIVTMVMVVGSGATRTPYSGRGAARGRLVVIQSSRPLIPGLPDGNVN